MDQVLFFGCSSAIMTELIDCIHQFEQARSAESSCNSIIWVSCLSNLFNLPSYLANPFSAGTA